MSLGSSNMVGTALGTAFSLLLCASIIQGQRDLEMTSNGMMEGVVGQNITIRCSVKSRPELKIVNIEWSVKKNEYTKLALYSQGHGSHLFLTNVSMQIESDGEDNITGSSLHLSEVKKWDSGIYICDIATFPFGSIRRETELKIKDIKLMCDADSAVEVHTGENVTIHCRASPNAQYRWTKNEKLVSENEFLELRCVSEAHTGVYTLTVNTGNESLHKTFTIRVLAATTSLRTDVTTVSPQANVTGEGLLEPSDRSLTSLTTGLSTTDTTVTVTMSMGTSVTDGNPSPGNATVTAGEHITSSTNYTHVNVTESPATHTGPYHLLNSTTLSYDSTVLTSTQEMTSDEMGNTSMQHTVHPADIFSIRQEESSTVGNLTEGRGATQTSMNGKVGKDTEQSHLVVLIILPILVLIAVAGFLYRRHLIKQRMNLPPPFKPPHPPVKYAPVRYREISTQPFPTARCNSITDCKDTKQTFIKM
ncbi:T-cell surface protein tactile [Toxotes jaculatrix]|uniref:T-cell surface protein tactile n=1 Tax=Toxotes jaculatrix TaxID=941984 RepID=UPI001B3B12DE|nr:T-cell surface protein tactile [Toxotes jaculatrix]